MWSQRLKYPSVSRLFGSLESDSSKPAEKTGINIANERMAATIWFFVSVDANVPMERKYAPMSAIARYPATTGPRSIGVKARRIAT